MVKINRGIAAGAALAAAGVTIAGCGGGGAKPSAFIRGINAATTVDAAKSLSPARIVVNNGPAFGDRRVSDPPSGYLFIETESTSSFSYANLVVATGESLFPTAEPGPNPVPLITTYTLTTGRSYTTVLAGRPDQVAVTGTTSPATALRSYVFVDMPPSIPAGSAALRVLNAAPDAGAVDVYLNGAVGAGLAAVPYLTQPASDAAAPAFRTLPAGTYSVMVKPAGAATTLIPATNVTLAAGQSYTILVGEPTNTGGTATYALNTFSP
jgi:hypothetical protein